MADDPTTGETNFGTDQAKLSEIADDYGLTPQTIRNWIATGVLHGTKRGRGWTVSRAAVAQMLSENPTLGKPRTGRSPTASVDAQRSPGGSDEPLVSRDKLREHARRAETLWTMSIRAFDPVPSRMRALADGANAQARVIHLAELAELPWLGRQHGVVLPDSLQPGADRDGPPKVWAAFDDSVNNLREQMRTDGNNRAVYLAFEQLRDAANTIADALDPTAAIDAAGDLRDTA